MLASKQRSENKCQMKLGEIMKDKNKRRIITSKKRLKIFCFLCSEVCILSSGKAALIYPLDDLKVIEVPISQAGLTRITVKGDRIANVFGVAGEYFMEADETQGQVFVRPMEPALHPISITLTTEGGDTQDLRLVPKNQAPEALILKTEAANNAKQNAPWNNQSDTITRDAITRNEIEDLLYACAEGRIPTGYKSVALEIPAPDEPYHLIAEVQNDKLHGLTYEVKNLATIPWILAESGFAQKLNINAVAVLMPKKLLNPGESTYVYVAEKSL
jgi:type-F conjugative transfer system secretin TraK